MGLAEVFARFQRTHAMVLPLALLTVMIFGVGYGTHERMVHEARKNAERELQGLSDIRRAELSNWLENLRLRNARPPGSALPEGVLRAASDPAVLARLRELLRWQVETTAEYPAGWLLDAGGQIVVSVGTEALPPLTSPSLREVSEAGEARIHDFYLSDQGTARLAVITPLISGDGEGEGRVAGFMVVAVDPEYVLYPTLRRGLTFKAPIETFIARHEGRAVRYLNPLLDAPEPLRLLIDTPASTLLAERALSAEGVVLEGTDYRGVAVLGVAHRVVEMDWVVVTKMDVAAVHHSVKGQFGALALRLGVLLALLVVLFWLAQRYFRVQSDLQQVSSDLEQVRHEKLSEFFVRYAHDVVLLMDESGSILQVNEAARDVYGYSEEELIGANISRLRAPESLDTLGDHLKAADTPAGITFRTTHMRRDGSVFPVEVSSGTFDHQGRRYRQSIIRDISERELAEARLRKALDEQILLNRRLEDAQNQLLQSEKMASIGQLAAGVAHEINNPVGFVSSNLGSLRQYLNSVLTVVDYAERRYGSDEGLQAVMAEQDMAFIREDAPTLLDESLEGIARVRKIVQDLKDFSRVGETDWQWADIHAGLDSTVNIVWNEIKYKATLDKDYGRLPDIWCLPSQLNQVFLNLLVNAAHAIRERGRITLRSGMSEDGEQVWVEVCDTGAGIAPEHLSKLFDPFFTTKPVGQGTGLGLSLAFSIVQKHGGQIEVSSTPGRGSCFRVVLARVPPQAPSPENPAVQTSEVSA